MREYFIKTKEKDCFPFDEWITSLEMRAFGWTDKKHRTDWYDEYFITFDSDYSSARVTQKSRTYRVFKRIDPYSGNLLFKFLELLMSIQSWIRRKLIVLLWFIDAILLVLGVITLIAGGGMNEFLASGIAVTAFVYLPSLIIAALGFLTRIIFGIDHKLKDNLEANGYKREQNI